MAKEPAMRPTGEPVGELLERISGVRRAEAEMLLELHRQVSGSEPVVWAHRIIGFGELTYRYDSGHGGHSPVLAFASGAARHTVYLIPGFAEHWPDVLTRLGTYRASVGCLYLPRLTGVDMDALREILVRVTTHSPPLSASDR